MTENYRIKSASGGERLDVFLSQRFPDLSRVRLKHLIEGSYVLVNGIHAKPSLRLKAGAIVDVVIPPPERLNLEAEDIPVTVIYEDSDLLVVDKPAGLPVHPGAGHTRHTLVNALLALCTDLSGIGGILRPGIVHRLDKDTSGLMVVAKNDAVHQDLADQLKKRSVIKKYLAMVWGTPDSNEGLIEAPVGRHPVHRQKMAVITNGRYALTRYQIKKVVGEFSLVEVFPSTGRTHQIRVHLSSIGHPIVGDSVYSNRRVSFLTRQFLHASFLGFEHPKTGQNLRFDSQLPNDLQEALDATGF